MTLLIRLGCEGVRAGKREGGNVQSLGQQVLLAMQRWGLLQSSLLPNIKDVISL